MADEIGKLINLKKLYKMQYIKKIKESQKQQNEKAQHICNSSFIP